MTRLADLTTIKVGGEPASLKTCTTRDELIEETLKLWRKGEDWLILGGGSNIVAAENLDDLYVIQVATKGVESTNDGDNVTLLVEAGENWDDLVAGTVAAGLAGLEALSGIPGSVGASPVQNIGAYGQEVTNLITRIEFLDYETHDVVWLSNSELKFAYRDSAIKQGRLGLITRVEFQLKNLNGFSEPIAFDQLAKSLNANLGDSIEVTMVRDAVLKLRAAKGMVLDANDTDTTSCGSFFTNPIVSASFARTLPSNAPKFETPENDGATVKLSAAWLIENSGIKKGFALAGSKARISTKHTLAITNTGNATADEITELASFVQQRVLNTFGVNLVPEPNLVGF